MRVILNHNRVCTVIVGWQGDWCASTGRATKNAVAAKNGILAFAISGRNIDTSPRIATCSLAFIGGTVSICVGGRRERDVALIRCRVAIAVGADSQRDVAEISAA